VTHLGADTLPGNRAIHGLLASLFGTQLDVTYEGGVVHYSLLVATARPTTPTIAPSTDTRRLVAV
jgi:hypothetical protein